jgi:hypothetical protein
LPSGGLQLSSHCHCCIIAATISTSVYQLSLLYSVKITSKQEKTTLEKSFVRLMLQHQGQHRKVPSNLKMSQTPWLYSQKRDVAWM